MQKGKIKLTQKDAENSPAGGVVIGKRKGQTMIYDDASLGGYFVGKTHAEGGIKMINKSNGQPLEVQGSEVIITAPAVADQTKHNFNGKMMTNREILSEINVKGGGVAFAKGGDIPKKIKRTGASYNYGGKTMTDHEIYEYITGGHLAEDYSLREIANIHQVPLSELKEQVRMGMKAESEHTSSKREQMKIVKDHLFENPKYYSLLKKAGLKDGGELYNSENDNVKHLLDRNLETDLAEYKLKEYLKSKNIQSGMPLPDSIRNDEEYRKLKKDFDSEFSKMQKKPIHKNSRYLDRVQRQKDLRRYKEILDDIIKQKFKKGGQVESLVRDAKSGNTPARDLNNYNDMLDVEADGQVGGDTGLFAGGGMMVNGGLIAPNGKPSGLYFTEIYNLVRTPEFKAWFGDWEEAYITKDYDGVSKIIDENGQPLICVHNSPNEFFEFDEYKMGSTTDAGYYGKGFYFFPNVGFDKYGKIEYNCFLNIKNPYFKQSSHRNYELKSEELKNEDFDGVIVYPNFYKDFNFKNGVDNAEEIVAYYSEQIKLADGSNTTFDANNPDIRFDDGGKLGGETILFAVRKGEPDYNEVLITNNPDRIEDAKKWALANGFDRLRVSKIDMREKPDFEKTFAEGGNVKPYDANMEGDSADMIFAEGGAVSSVVRNWNEVPSIWKDTKKVKKVAWTNSPYDKGLYSIIAPFLGKDELRPIFSGINFDENGITVTDAHKLISLPYPNKQFEGIYHSDLSKYKEAEQITIDGKYPNYSAIIPESKNTIKYEVDVYKLLQYTNVAIKYANKTTYAINYKIYDELMGFNGKFLIEVLTTFLKLGHDKIYAHFVGYTKAFVFSPNKNYELGNDDLILLMPVMVSQKLLGASDIDYNRELSVYYDFNDNEIHNANGSIAEFKMTYVSNSVISKEDVNLLEKLANGKNILQILNYVKVKDSIARASDLESEYYLSGVDLPDGIYKPNKGALEITMEAIEDFPSKPQLVLDDQSLEFTIDSDVLEYYVDKFKNVVGKDELRPVMQGICLHHTSDNKLFLAGTDANILLKINITEYVSMPEVFKDMKFIIQPKRLYDFLNSTEHTNLRIKCNSVATTIDSDKWSFYARNIDGNYPNYDAVIPTETTKLVRVAIEPIKKAFNSESIKNYVKEVDKSKDVFVFNKEQEIFIANSGKRFGSNDYDVNNIQKICETNVNFTIQDYYNYNKNVLLIMPYGYDKQTNFSFRKDLLERVFKIINSNTLDLHYTEMNRAYLIPIDTFDFKGTTKEHKVKEQKPSVAEIKLVSTINEVNEIKEAIETLEMLLETATRKDKKEIKEAIEVLQMLLDTYEY